MSYQSIPQMTEVLKAGVLSDEIDLGALAHNAAEQAEEFVRKVSELFMPGGDWHKRKIPYQDLRYFVNFVFLSINGICLVTVFFYVVACYLFVTHFVKPFTNFLPYP